MAKQNLTLSQISESVKNLLDIVLRNDERLKIALKEQEDIKEEFSDLKEKTQKLEIKLETASVKLGSHDARWTRIFDMVWKVGLMIAAGYILYALGLQADLAFPPP